MLFDVMIVVHPELHLLQVRYPLILLKEEKKEIRYNQRFRI
jgi:hypothetical protein